MATLVSSKQAPLCYCLLWPNSLRLAGFIHHSRQVSKPQPKGRTANKLPGRVDYLPYLTWRPPKPFTWPDTLPVTALVYQGLFSWCFYSGLHDLGCLSDRSLELLLHVSEICLLIFASVPIGCVLLSQRLGLWPLLQHPALTITQTTLEHIKEISRNRMPNIFY